MWKSYECAYVCVCMCVCACVLTCICLFVFVPFCQLKTVEQQKSIDIKSPKCGNYCKGLIYSWCSHAGKWKREIIQKIKRALNEFNCNTIEQNVQKEIDSKQSRPVLTTIPLRIYTYYVYASSILPSLRLSVSQTFRIFNLKNALNRSEKEGKDN